MFSIRCLIFTSLPNRVIFQKRVFYNKIFDLCITNFYRKLQPLNTLVVFEAAFRLCSFSRASDQVVLSQASVRRQIRQLESNLGVRLFERQRHDVMPTTEGKVLAASVRLALHELAITANQLRSTDSVIKNFTIFQIFPLLAF